MACMMAVRPKMFFRPKVKTFFREPSIFSEPDEMDGVRPCKRQHVCTA
ncbi:hypothetical protein [Bacillus haynesii]|nr:hypothetical protein [Bacillus haynesii]MEC1477565.1 hypothetical protein [Bacillus haynesii]